MNADDPPAGATAQERTTALLRELWTRKLPLVQQQIGQIEQAQTANPPSTALRTNAAAAAHKLAGSLGMFGYHNGTTIARQLEVYLDTDQPLATPAFATLLQQLRTSLNL